MIMWQSPHLPVPKWKKTARHVHSGAKKGNLRTSPGETGAVALIACEPDLELAVIHQGRVMGAECVMSRAAQIFPRRFPIDLAAGRYHEFVIGVMGT
jgi:hypothetical protein